MKEKLELENKLVGLKEAKKKTEAYLTGTKQCIVYRTVVIGGTTFVLAGSLASICRLAEYIMEYGLSENILKTLCAVLGIGVSAILIPVAGKVLKWENENLCENLEMLNFTKQCLQNYNENIEEAMTLKREKK